jgi:hypothetical protein
MAKITFSIQQAATVTWTGHLEVPDDLDLDDPDAVREYIEDNDSEIQYDKEPDNIEYDSMDFETLEVE